MLCYVFYARCYLIRLCSRIISLCYKYIFVFHGTLYMYVQLHLSRPYRLRNYTKDRGQERTRTSLSVCWPWVREVLCENLRPAVSERLKPPIWHQQPFFMITKSYHNSPIFVRWLQINELILITCTFLAPVFRIQTVKAKRRREPGYPRTE